MLFPAVPLTPAVHIFPDTHPAVLSLGKNLLPRSLQKNISSEGTEATPEMGHGRSVPPTDHFVPSIPGFSDNKHLSAGYPKLRKDHPARSPVP